MMAIPRFKCPCATDCSLWLSIPSKVRSGWVLTECSRCKKFIGWCPEAIFYKEQAVETKERYT